jgi:hypothetical protein
VTPLLVVTLHTKAERAEEPEHAKDSDVKDSEDRPLDALAEIAGVPIKAEARAQDSEVQSRVVVVNVGDTCHGDERQVVQEPAEHGVDAGVVEVVDLRPGELVVAALPADRVPGNHAEEEDDREGRAPVYERVAEQEVLDDVVVPAAHAETDVQERPLPGLGGEVILLVGVGHEGVVRGHHGDIEVDKVAEERRLVRARVACGDCSVLVKVKQCNEVYNTYASRSSATRRSSGCKHREACSL